MGAILLTGMSGVGKSSVLAELARRGFETVDTDNGGWITRDGGEPLWHEPLMDGLLSRPRPGPLFVQGTVANQGRFYDRFDAVVLLSAPVGVILDIFSGPEAPEHIACTEFYREAAAKLSPRGVLIVNVGDEPGLTLVRSQVAALRRAVADVSAFAEAGMFSGRYAGNIILTGTQGPWPEVWTAALTARGPHPAKVLSGVGLDAFAD